MLWSCGDRRGGRGISYFRRLCRIRAPITASSAAMPANIQGESTGIAEGWIAMMPACAEVAASAETLVIASNFFMSELRKGGLYELPQSNAGGSKVSIAPPAPTGFIADQPLCDLGY